MKLTINKKIVSVSFLLLALIMLGAVSYAYFTADVEGNEGANKTRVTTGIMSLKLDGTTIVGTSKMVPGQQHTTTFTVENTGNLDALYNIDMIEVNNTYATKRDLVYTITSDNGGGKKSETELPSETGTILHNVYIKAGVKQTYTITVIFKDDREIQNENEGKSFSGKIQINNLEENAIATTILRKNKIQTEAPDFSQASPDSKGTDHGTGLFATQDDDGTSYYFRGAIDNNNVHFAEMDWKILRINGDGSIRLILNKTIGSSAFNENHKSCYTCDNLHACTKDNPCISNYDAENGNFTSNYGDKEMNDSTVKIFLENWYIENIVQKVLNDKVALSNYCNDTSIYQLNSVYNSPYQRFSTSQPSLKCPNPTEADGLTIHNDGGVYKLKIGLHTSDEVNIMGYAWSSSPGDNIYFNQRSVLTMSAYSPSRMFYNNIDQHYDNYIKATTPYNIVPVINLKPDVEFTTDREGEPGTTGNPYVVS